MPGLRTNSKSWVITSSPAGGAKRATSGGVAIPAEFLTSNSYVAQELVAQPSPAAKRAVAPAEPLDFSCPIRAGEAALLAIRHPSGALTFHLPVESVRRGGSRQGEARFVVQPRSTDLASATRGLVSSIVKAAIIKVTKSVIDGAVSMALPKLAQAFESGAFKKQGLSEGWFKVTQTGLSNQKLKAMTPASTERSLLLLHGTFSNAAAAFAPLASSNFIKRVAPIYGDRIYAFNHFTVSRSPEENARLLLEQLPDKNFKFDVVTHSRGGLVLRTLAEQASTFGSLGNRFSLGHGVLVACPNDGTPLATPDRWQETVGWIANLLEMFPDNPFTTGAEFVANGLVWIARHAAGDLPGLQAMDSRGDVIGRLQASAASPSGAYSALVANFEPSQGMLARMVDLGIDQFFGSANDLVVPSEGGWRVDDESGPGITEDRIACFGPGGNLDAQSVTHLGFFSQRETVDFLAAALLGQKHSLSPIDPASMLPSGKLFRAFGRESGGPGIGARRIRAALPSAGKAPSGRAHPVLVDGTPVVASDTFHVVILPRDKGEKGQSKILAHYGSARVLEDFRLVGETDSAGRRWQQIIAYHESIRNFIDNNVGGMPSREKLLDFGSLLFETLFPGKVRRLYDTARSLQRSERLNVILTSTISWVADKPWEFAYDPVRETSLATEDLHFIRNVMTAVPAEIIDDRKLLRILVASSQPVGSALLSIDEEATLIRRGFEPLIDAGLAEITVLPRATPASIHAHICHGNFSVVHFIGHGSFDPDKGEGYLIFQDDAGTPYPIGEQSAKEIFCGRGLRLVFLNACQTGRGGHADFNSGVAPALMAGGIPIVIANQYSVLDLSATLFAQHFYWSLAHGGTVAASVREARIAVNYSLADDRQTGGAKIDWAIPVVYARDPDSRLCAKRMIDATSAFSPAVRSTERARVAEHEERVAVWDANSQFPHLRSTLAQMNAAQSKYGFQVVDLSVPVDAWHIRDGEKYLDANRFAKRLAPQISQLGVHFICAIVDTLMVENLGVRGVKATYNLYGWWPAENEPNIVLFSTKDLGLPPRGELADRAIANVIVELLAGATMHWGSHEGRWRGATECPNYYNRYRSLKHLTGRQRFCSKCTPQLADNDKTALQAMNTLLRAFDK